MEELLSAGVVVGSIVLVGGGGMTGGGGAMETSPSPCGTLFGGLVVEVASALDSPQAPEGVYSVTGASSPPLNQNLVAL